MKLLLLPIEIHVAVCEFKATHRPTIAGLLLQNCVIQVSLLRGMWNSGAALTGVHPGAAVVFFKQYSIFFTSIAVVISESVVVHRYSWKVPPSETNTRSETKKTVAVRSHFRVRSHFFGNPVKCGMF